MLRTDSLPGLQALADLLLLHLRVSRLDLVRKMHVMEQQVYKVGGNTQKLRDVRHQLQQVNLAPQQETFLPEGFKRYVARHLAVKTNGRF